MDELILHTGDSKEILLIDGADTQLHVVQEADSYLKIHYIRLDGQSGFPTFEIDIDGEGCTTELYGLGLLRSNQTLDLTTRVHHNVGGSASKQLFKMVLGGESRGSFTGELLVAKHAQKTTAQQTNRNLLLSRNATMRTRPQLEIYADDVQCSHGATTGLLDESELFYMQQRCIGEQEARRMLQTAFFSDVLITLDKKLQEEITEKIYNLLTKE